MNKFTRKIYGFTLAEVLITLLIIGVVSSIVIPSVIQNSQEAEFRVAWKKSYAEIDQAIRKLAYDNGGDLVGLFQNANDCNNKIVSLMSYTKKCSDWDSPRLCWHTGQNLLMLNGSPEAFWADDCKPGVVLSNGNLLYVYHRSNDCTHNAANGLDFGICTQIMIDVNGFKAPNKIGKDIYGLWVKKNSIVPYGVTGDNFYKTTASTCSTSNSGWGCSAKYLYQ